jgi:hypothetical protein
VQEVWAGKVLLAFDGRVLEVFGFTGAESVRFHVRNMELSVDGPDSKGTYWVLVKPASAGGGVQLQVPQEDWAAVGPFLDAVLAAVPG